MVYKLVHPDGTEADLPEGTEVFAVQPFTGARGKNANQMNRYLFTIWLVVLGILGVTLFLFGILAYRARGEAATAAFLMAPATTALGAIAGLLAPSPTSNAAADG